ncbi:DMT family transporter [Natronobacterium texcoconense]|uniref:Threonine/homoserine efflux transporter RhtA n=1 Tax=Natronobacterium texcoconense TaxID=1095778 RepID=A0A1H1BW84_NATTX|nr:DMT family transporter [Natronobacterium texcoconense]SDQ56169.1 Threonine/homoserine efflux transporter RhtA [Natronobacterium texcoconense]
MASTGLPISTIDRRTIGVVFVLLAAIGFGTIAIFGKLATEAGLNNPTLLTFRFVLATALLLGYLEYRGELGLPSGRQFGTMAGLGVAYAALTAAFFWGLLYVPAGIATITLYTYPVYVFLIATTLLDERLRPGKFVALVLAIAGVATIVGLDTTRVDPRGLVLVTVAAMAYAVYTTGSRVAVGDVGADRLATAAIATTGICFLAYGSVSRTLFVPETARQWAVIVGLAIVGTVVPILLFVNGLRFVEADRASIVSTAEPVVTVVLGVVILGERLSPGIVVGGTLVLVGIALIQSDRRSGRPAAPSSE